jgi:GNAT superfamily N-acetyltransferase
MGSGQRYVIRGATVSDASEIARLAGELGYPATGDEISSRLKSLANYPDHFLVVAAVENGDQLLGWIAAEKRILLIATPRIEIMGLVVDQSARRAGVGRRLIAAAEQWAREREINDIVVRSNVLRQESHAVYVRLGYSREKSQHVYVKHLLLPEL